MGRVVRVFKKVTFCGSDGVVAGALATCIAHLALIEIVSRKRARKTCRRGGARQNRAASTLAVKPAHAPRAAPVSPLAIMSLCSLLLCCQTETRSAGRWIDSYIFHTKIWFTLHFVTDCWVSYLQPQGDIL